ncbi:MAG: cadmium-translocating P-type ATPase [Anaerolineae bacterium]|nr:cadmium-translocating P-type ATPase [Anaerolineae bacterium]BCY16646.1 ATPase [Leptolinea sp. HRD-7]
MIEKTVEISLPLLLPEGQESCNHCIDRLQSRLQTQKGILQTHLHLDHDPIDLCIHYDPNLISLAAVKRIAEEAGSELRNGYHHEQIPFTGLDSADSATMIAKELENMDGMLHASVSYAAGFAMVAYDTKIVSLEQIHRTMRHLGARLLPQPEIKGEKEAHEHEHDHGTAPSFLPHWIQERWTIILIATGGVFLLLGWVGQQFLGYPASVSRILFLLSYVASAYDIGHHAIPALLRGKFDTDVLMLAAAVGAAFLGAWAEGAFLLFLFGLGHAGEHYALDRARNAINALGELMPKTARVRRGDQIIEESVDLLSIDDIVIVRPGDRIPVDGVISFGESAIDQSPITGESVPVQKAVGDEVFTGTINQDAALEVKITRLAKDNTLSRVMKMVAEAQGQQSPTQQFTDRFSARFVPIVLILVALVAVVPPIAGWMTFSDSFYRAMLLLVAASPCALAIGTPATVLAGIAQAARNGVLIKGGVHLENLGRLNAFAFDKTGTLTQGKFHVTDVIPLDDSPIEDILRLAAAVEQQSSHPLALAIVRAAQERNLTLPMANSLENVPGRGVRSQVEGQPVWIGSLKLFEENDGKIVDETVRQTVLKLENAGRTTMTVSHNGKFLGVLGLADVARPNVEKVLARLRNQGVKHLIMLTGDNQKVAQQIAQSIGVTDIEAELLPEDKLTTIQRLKKEFGAVAMIGDGVNDAPALATSTVGIAMGGAGTAVALETADVALMADDLSKLPFAVGLSRTSRTIIQQNLVISLGVIFLLIITSVFGLVQLSWTVVAHEGSTILVVMNALRLLRYKNG